MKTTLFDLGGKVAIVTGGNGGIGLGMVKGLAEAGAAVAIVGRNEVKSVAAVAELERDGARAISVVADVTDKAAVDAMAARVARELGRIDILVNNAGINRPEPAEDYPDAAWRKVMSLNIDAQFFLAREVGKRLLLIAVIKHLHVDQRLCGGEARSVWHHDLDFVLPAGLLVDRPTVRRSEHELIGRAKLLAARI